MPTALPDHTTTRRPQPVADVTRRAVLRRFMPLASLFLVEPVDVSLWLRCWRSLDAPPARPA